MDSKKYNKLVNITKKKRTDAYRKQTSGYQQGEVKRGRGSIGVEWRIKSANNWYKISHKDTFYNKLMHLTAWITRNHGNQVRSRIISLGQIFTKGITRYFSF